MSYIAFNAVRYHLVSISEIKLKYEQYHKDVVLPLFDLPNLCCHMCLFTSTHYPSFGRLFADDTLKRIFLNENVGISIKISLKFVHKGPINN